MGKGAPLCLIIIRHKGAPLAFHIMAFIATAQQKLVPVTLSLLPLKGHSQGRWNREGGGGACSPTPKKCPLFYVKSAIFKVKHAPSLLRKRTYFSIFFVPKCVGFFPLRGTVMYREGTKLAKGHLNAFSPSY